MKKHNIFLRLSARYGYLLIGYMIFSFLLSHIFVKGSELISDAIDDMLDGLQIDISYLFGVTACFVALSMVFAFLKKICGETYSIYIQKDSKNFVAKCIDNMKYSYIGKEAGAFITKLTSDVDKMRELFSEIVPEVLQSLVTIIVLGVSIFMLDWKLLVSVFICFPVVLYIGNRLAISLNRLAKARREKYDVLTQVARDNIAGIVIARSFHLLDVLQKRVDLVIDEILQNEIARNRYQSIGTVIQSLTQWFPTVVCAFIALVEVVNGELAIGEFIAFVMLFQKIAAPLSELPFRINDGREIFVSVKRINDIYHAPMEQSGSYCADKIEAAADNALIRLNNASFWYANHAERKILQDINLAFECGKTTAIVGKSGCGKTTLFKILCGFEQLNDGTYFLGSHKFQEWNLASARKRNDEVYAAAKLANAHDFIMMQENGYQTVLKSRAQNLSGGERQRIAVARAILKDAPIILLDEATSALDNETAFLVPNVVEGLKRKKTIVAITHKKAMMDRADFIINVEINA